MKKAVIRISVVVLSLVIILGTGPLEGLTGLKLPGWLNTDITAFAASASDLSYEFINEGKEVEITDCASTASGSLAIPSKIEGKPVTSIGYMAFFICDGLTSITIPNSVTNIGEEAFEDCTDLSSFTIPNSVISIGKDAFSDCDGLTSVTIGSSVTSIGDWAFGNCISLKSVIIGNKVTSIGDSTFIGCNSLTSITIPNSVKSIGDFAFFYCDSLTSITIPASVKSIGDSAFSGCGSLTSIHVEISNPSYSSVGGVLFNKDKTVLILCPGGKSGTVNIPSSVTNIESYAFSVCSDLKNITIPDSVKSIGEYAFEWCLGLTSITIPNSVTSIGEDVFSFEDGNLAIKIYCYKNSAAHIYAVKNKLDFVLLDAVTAKAASTSYNSIKISWLPLTGAAGYVIYRSDTSTGTYAYLAKTASTSYIDAMLTTGQMYYYTVSAVKTVNGKNEYYFESAVVSARPVPAIPASPKAVSNSYNSIKLSWNAVSGATGYTIYRSVTKKGNYKYLTKSTTTSYIDTSLTTGKIYYYKVAAYRTVNEKNIYSTSATTVNVKPVPSIPASFSAVRASSTSIITSWSAVEGATGYVVFRYNENTKSYDKIKVTASTSYTNTGLVNDTTYSYKVAAYHTESGTNIYGLYTAVKSA